MNLLDNDFYKFCVSQAARTWYPGTVVEMRLQVRSGCTIKYHPDKWSFDRFTKPQLDWLGKHLTPGYVEWLDRWQFDKNWVKRCEPNELWLRGPWEAVTLLEIPLLAMAAERTMPDFFVSVPKHVNFYESGTRRRCSAQYQRWVVQGLLDHPGFLGTSNCQLAMDFGVQPSGTVPHEWIMGIGCLDSYQHTHRIAAVKWAGTSSFTPDTYGIDAFLREKVDLKGWSSIRHDSGPVRAFIEKISKAYPHHQLGFSDGQSPMAHAFPDNGYFGLPYNAIRFGLGSSLTNPMPGCVQAVIKPYAFNGRPACKLSDTPGKEFGQEDIVRAVKTILR